MHIDNKNMLEFIAKKLKVGKVFIAGRFVYFSVYKQSELKIIFNIFDKYPLNTSKNLNYIM